MTNEPFRHEVFFAAASDSCGFTGPSVLVRKSRWMTTASLYQHRRTSRPSVKVYPRCGSKKDLVTPFMPLFLNKIRQGFGWLRGLPGCFPLPVSGPPQKSGPPPPHEDKRMFCKTAEPTLRKAYRGSVQLQDPRQSAHWKHECRF